MSEAGSRGLSAAPQGLEGVSPETPLQTARRHTGAQLSPLTAQEGRPLPQDNLQIVLIVAGTVTRCSRLGSHPPLTSYPIPSTFTSCTVGLSVASSSPLTALAEPMQTFLLPPCGDISANRKQLCCQVQAPWHG